jgi:hypothetical protein
MQIDKPQDGGAPQDPGVTSPLTRLTIPEKAKP